MKTEIWYFLACLLDTTPFIYLLYRPMRKHLRLPLWLTMLINHLIMLGAAVGFVALHRSPYYSLQTMLLYRVTWSMMLLALSPLFIRRLWGKALYVFSLIIPFIAALLLLSAFIAQHIRSDGSPTYMVSSLIRLGLTVALYPLLLLLWKEMGRRSDYLTDQTFWRYAWLIPASTGIAEILMISNTYETVGVSVNELIGRLLLCVGSVVTCWLVFFMADQTESHARLENANERSDLLLALQAKQYQELATDVERARASRHDLRHHLNTMKVMLDNGQYTRLGAYLDDILEQLPRSSRITICENYAANAVLDYFITQAGELGVPIKVNFRVSRDMGISDTDLCVLLGNAMENAMDATLRVEPAKRYIIARAMEEDDRIYITFDNSFDGELKADGKDAFLSRKRGYSTSGVGITSIRAIVAKYRGDIRISAEDGVFRLSVLLYKPERAAE